MISNSQGWMTIMTQSAQCCDHRHVSPRFACTARWWPTPIPFRNLSQWPACPFARKQPTRRAGSQSSHDMESSSWSWAKNGVEIWGTKMANHHFPQTFPYIFPWTCLFRGIPVSSFWDRAINHTKIPQPSPEKLSGCFCRTRQCGRICLNVSCGLEPTLW